MSSSRPPLECANTDMKKKLTSTLDFLKRQQDEIQKLKDELTSDLNKNASDKANPSERLRSIHSNQESAIRDLLTESRNLKMHIEAYEKKQEDAQARPQPEVAKASNLITKMEYYDEHLCVHTDRWKIEFSFHLKRGMREDVRYLHRIYVQAYINGVLQRTPFMSAFSRNNFEIKLGDEPGINGNNPKWGIETKQEVIAYLQNAKEKGMTLTVHDLIVPERYAEYQGLDAQARD